MILTGGQIGWDHTERFQTHDFVGQVRQALKNTLTVLAEAGARPEHVARMNWYITDREEYLANRKEMGKIYREMMGEHFPAMSMVQVAALIEKEAKVEVETTAIIPRH